MNPIDAGGDGYGRRPAGTKGKTLMPSLALLEESSNRRVGHVRAG